MAPLFDFHWIGSPFTTSTPAPSLVKTNLRTFARKISGDRFSFTAVRLNYFCLNCQKNGGHRYRFREKACEKLNWFWEIGARNSAWSTNVLKRELVFTMQAAENFSQTNFDILKFSLKQSTSVRGFVVIPQSLALRSIVLGWIKIYRKLSICTTKLPSIASRTCRIILLCKYKNHTRNHSWLVQKPFLWKWVWFAWKWTCWGNSFSHLDSFWYRGKRQFGNGLIN